HGPVAVDAGGVALARGDGLEVGARAERAARAGEDGDGEIFVAVELAERARQCRRGGPVDGVAALGPVDGDDEDVVVRLGANGHTSVSDGGRTICRCRRALARATRGHRLTTVSITRSLAVAGGALVPR